MPGDRHQCKRLPFAVSDSGGGAETTDGSRHIFFIEIFFWSFYFSFSLHFKLRMRGGERGRDRGVDSL